MTRLAALGIGLFAFLSGGIAARQQPAAAVDIETIGPRVGEALPAFSLRDQGGQARTLPSLLGPNGAVIVFFRSADW